MQAGGNDAPGPLGWRSASHGPPRDNQRDLQDLTWVNPAERWAAAVRTALSGPAFQAACALALGLPSAPTSGHNGATTQVRVVADSVRAEPAGSFGWADGWPPGYLVDDLDGKPFDFTDHDDEEGPLEGLGAAAGSASRRLTLASAQPGWASEVYHTGGFALEKPCEPGFWCGGGVRHACPAGRYGARARSTDLACDGGCAAGYFCPAGSASPVAHVCAPRGADPNVYCPANSGAPAEVPRGFYSYGDGGGGTKRFAKPFALVDANGNGHLDWLEFSASGPALEAAHAAAATAASSSHGAAVDFVGGAFGAAARPTVAVAPGVYGATPAAAYDKTPAAGQGSAAADGDVLLHALRAELRALWERADRDASGELDPREYYEGVVLAVRRGGGGKCTQR